VVIALRSFIVVGVALVFASGRLVAQNSSFELEVFKALTRLRADPGAYAKSLEEQRQYYRGIFFERPGRTPIETQEGVRALNEAIAALRPLRGSIGEVALSRGMTRAAREHVTDTGSRGSVGHGDFAQRISRFGTWSGGIAENISYGEDEPGEVISQLLIDDGVRDRGHRRNLLDPRWRYVGIACGAHARYGRMCVLDFAVAYHDKE
jgi:uncharacterized protein YkwD